jgi:hypothetical protein
MFQATEMQLACQGGYGQDALCLQVDMPSVENFSLLVLEMAGKEMPQV